MAKMKRKTQFIKKTKKITLKTTRIRVFDKNKAIIGFIEINLKQHNKSRKIHITYRILNPKMKALRYKIKSVYHAKQLLTKLFG